MEAAKTVTAQIKARGQLTIPKKIREMSNMEEGSVVSIVPVGESLVITPKRIELDEARRQLRKLLKASGLAIGELIEGLKEQRDELYRETYGPKKKM
jgi:AbrB family looped-hinge helix DNA binding protein